ncbi:sigma-70 region 4 domain-containing protein [Polaribacter sp.]|nr:sigma-70 region 4 domain-containing protein [Polaribacter sp.]
MAEILALMKPAEKIILLMKYQEDMRIKEIMCVLKISESAVKMRIKRAKAKVVKIHREL